MTYTQNDLLKLAKRYNNPKRSYLLVDPLQGKHLAVSPTAALNMMAALGDMLHEKYPTARLVIGFAETATAIGAAAAERLGDCKYIHTTREDIAADSWLYFSEEHSHASEQKLCADKLSEYAECTDTVILIDDEISTGKTLINIVERLRTVRGFEGKRIVAASIISRVSEENLARLEQAGIISECLLKLPEEDYTSAVERFAVTGAEHTASLSCTPESHTLTLADPRIGVDIKEYAQHCRTQAEILLDSIGDKIPTDGRILVLGTEEFMYPALILGRVMEARGYTWVRSHSTTRSPIGICTAEDYPIREGYAIRSFYENGRETFIYNPAQYDAAVIVTDGSNTEAVDDIAAVLARHGSPVMILAEVHR
ncbi:MAG: hypothetical protein E7478_07975 [Ruminococcaceae bacterium]|nr:hypothetical protein [Oscillospiraceae bacterium]